MTRSRLVSPVVNHVWSFAHPALLHGESGVRCSNCWDLDADGSWFLDDAFEAEMREAYESSQRINADDPYSQDRSEDLSEADPSRDHPIILIWELCRKCSNIFQMPEHIRDALEVEGRLIFCESCR